MERRESYATVPAVGGEPAQADATRPEAWFKGSLPVPVWASDPVWLARYGRALPLVLYLVKRADWQTGLVRGYRHKDAAAYLHCSTGAVAQQFRLLRESAAIAVTERGRYDIDVQLATNAHLRLVPVATTATADTTDYQFFDSLESGGYREVDSLTAPGYQESASLESPDCQKIDSPYITSENLTSERITANAVSAAVADAPPVAAASPSKSGNTAQASQAAQASNEPSQRPPRKRAAPPTTAKPVKAPEEPTPRRAFQIALMEAVTEANGGVRPPDWEQHWGSAGQLFAKGIPLDKAIACYREEVRRPKWQSKLCPVAELHSAIGPYLRSPEGFRASVERQRAASRGAFDQKRASPPRPERPQPPAPVFVPASSKDIWA